jgi:hypothetical protein
MRCPPAGATLVTMTPDHLQSRAFQVIESTIAGDETLGDWRARRHPPRPQARRWWRAVRQRPLAHGAQA